MFECLNELNNTVAKKPDSLAYTGLTDKKTKA
jgi:hypothetical protein